MRFPGFILLVGKHFIDYEITTFFQYTLDLCFDIDNFRLMVAKHDLLNRFTVTRDQKRRINGSDTELLKFGFEWIKNFLGASSSLLSK